MILTQGAGGGWALPWERIETKSKLVQLYNLKDDPGESKNLEDAHPEIVNELVDELAKALHNGRTTPGPKQKNDGWPYRDKPTMAKFPQLKEK